MKWIYDACGNAVLEEVAFAGMGVPAIWRTSTSPSAPRDAADAATCLLGRLVRKLAEANVSACPCGGRRACAVSPLSLLTHEKQSFDRCLRSSRGGGHGRRQCPSDIRCAGDIVGVPFPRARRKRPAGAAAEVAPRQVVVEARAHLQRHPALSLAQDDGTGSKHFFPLPDGPRDGPVPATLALLLFSRGREKGLSASQGGHHDRED